LPEPEAVPLPAELKAYTLFQPGTYWIYQDSASQQLDSVWVVSTERSVYRLGKSQEYPSVKHEDFQLRTRSSRGGPDQLYSVYRSCGMPIQEDATDRSPCWSIRRGRYLPTSTADDGGTDVFPYLIARDKVMFVNGYDAVMYPYWHSQPRVIGGQSYEGVLEVNLTADASEGGWPSHYAWAPGQGIVRHRVRQAGRMQTWTLLRSHIVQ
jgi:hypothetical protein